MSCEDKSTSGTLPVLSQYDSSLSADAKRRYLQKIMLLDGWLQSPDRIIDCTCCGKGFLEIKCHHQHRCSTISSALEDSQFCLESVDGEVSLKLTHSNFYQVQTQLYVCKADFCDFCVCLFHPDSECDFFVERFFRTVLGEMFVQKGRDCFSKIFCCHSWLESDTPPQVTA